MSGGSLSDTHLISLKCYSRISGIIKDFIVKEKSYIRFSTSILIKLICIDYLHENLARV